MGEEEEVGEWEEGRGSEGRGSLGAGGRAEAGRGGKEEAGTVGCGKRQIGKVWLESHRDPSSKPEKAPIRLSVREPFAIIRVLCYDNAHRLAVVLKQMKRFVYWKG